MEDSFLWPLVLQFVLIALNAVFACTEIAVISVNDVKLARMTAAGDKRAARLSKLTSQPARFLATIQVAITLAGFLGSAFAADNFSGVLVEWLLSLGVKMPVGTLETIAVIGITLILSYITLIFGELVPKRVAMKKAEPLALGISGFISVMSKFFSPLVWLLTASTNAVLRFIGIDPNAEEEHVSEEEIRMMVDAGSEKGVIDQSEKKMIQNIFEFDDMPVSEFATHRTDVTFLWEEESLEQWDKTIRESRYSQYPICGETADDVKGVLNTKDYFRLTDRSLDNIMEKAVRPAYFVPGSIRADVLFGRMQASRKHFAVVLDEYGGVLGIVTMNDLLEQIVGDLDDGTFTEAELCEISKMDDETWMITGSAPLHDVCDALDVSLPTDEYDTFGGFVFGVYGSIPDDGSVFETDAGGLHVQVLVIKDHRIEKTVVTKLPNEDGEEAEE